MQLTDWLKAETVVESGWGSMPYDEWCEREAARIQAAGGEVWVHKRKRKDRGVDVPMVCVEEGKGGSDGLQSPA